MWRFGCSATELRSGLFPARRTRIAQRYFFLVARIVVRYAFIIGRNGAAMILNFKNKLAETVWNGTVGKGFPADLVRPAQRKLAMLNAAVTLDALRVPPANRLEALRGDRAGQHSIRVNDQFRVCFVWRDGHAADVEIVDYH